MGSLGGQCCVVQHWAALELSGRFSVMGCTEKVALPNGSVTYAVGEQTDCWAWERHRGRGHRK